MALETKMQERDGGGQKAVNETEDGKIRVRARFEFADGPEQERAIGLLAQLMAEGCKRVQEERKRAMEPPQAVNRNTGSEVQLDGSSYAVYTMKDQPS